MSAKVTGVATMLAANLAGAPIVPYDLGRTGPETVRHLAAVTRAARDAEMLGAEGGRSIDARLARVEAADLPRRAAGDEPCARCSDPSRCCRRGS